MNHLEWIKSIVESEDKANELGVIEINSNYQKQRALVKNTLDFLMSLKNQFTDAVNIYNEIKNSPLGRIKIYAIAQTHADFMLFRNGYKMIFSLKEPGIIAIKFNFIGSQIMSTAQLPESSINSKIFDDQFLIAKQKPFEEIYWTYQDQEFNTDYLVKYYLSLFARESLS